MIVERVSRRILAGVRFQDAITGERLRNSFEATAPGVRWIRNRSGDMVVSRAPGLDNHADAPDAPPAIPGLGTAVFQAAVHDPLRLYLPRRLRLALPRSAAVDDAGDAESLFQPIRCLMFRAPSAPVGLNWAVLRASVANEAGDGGLAGALLRLVRILDGALLGVGLTDERGEALVAAAGIPVTTWGESEEDAVIVTEVSARVEVVHDPDAAMPDPDDLEARREDLLVRSANVTLASGRQARLSL